jgi:hypothetical protein
MVEAWSRLEPYDARVGRVSRPGGIGIHEQVFEDDS